MWFSPASGLLGLLGLLGLRRRRAGLRRRRADWRGVVPELCSGRLRQRLSTRHCPARRRIDRCRRHVRRGRDRRRHWCHCGRVIARPGTESGESGTESGAAPCDSGTDSVTGSSGAWVPGLPNAHTSKSSSVVASPSGRSDRRSSKSNESNDDGPSAMAGTSGGAASYASGRWGRRGRRPADRQPMGRGGPGTRPGAPPQHEESDHAEERDGVRRVVDVRQAVVELDLVLGRDDDHHVRCHPVRTVRSRGLPVGEVAHPHEWARRTGRP